MNADNKLLRLIVVSPWSLLIFLVIPVLVILSVKFHIQLPFDNPTKLLTINNVCLVILVASRALWYLSRAGKAIRYSIGHGRPRSAVSLLIPRVETQQVLSNAGYSFVPEGTYGEKKDFGYLGTTIFYVGLFILLSVGIWDNMRQFSGTLLDGMGPATKLSRVQSYSRIHKGSFPAKIDLLPQLVITKQVFPDDNLPKGATEIALFSDDGKEQKRILVPGNPIRYGDFDISMTKLVFEPQIVIKTTDGTVLFDELVKLDPLLQKRGVFSFYGLYQGYNLGGGIYYQPEKNNLMVVVSRGEKKAVSEMVFQVDQQVTQGGYVISCAKMGQWSEIQVIHRRHQGLLVIGGIIAFIGLLLRTIIRPQRVWLEERPEGCLISSSGKDAMNLLKTEG
jgi:hypothetical protein